MSRLYTFHSAVESCRCHPLLCVYEVVYEITQTDVLLFRHAPFMASRQLSANCSGLGPAVKKRLTSPSLSDSSRCCPAGTIQLNRGFESSSRDFG
jgi:hypothetical protein